ncbi:hypothetical protein G5V57_02700 [Nordella sp. HKS 07]|uniref:hypothetical protein n=1 Tax=Nordella sp. HKS 07 TaxID=2712222 RepID=UPI0013E1D605|nr:hypothetical protein [Nordella sp. HKS 07]QIG46758.1 hypothetical protein G5V57_02700 [Nordella sp. HKS 07]
MRTILKTILLGTGVATVAATQAHAGTITCSAQSGAECQVGRTGASCKVFGGGLENSFVIDTDAKQMKCSHGGCLGTHPISISPYSISPGPVRIDIAVIASDRLPTQLDISVSWPHQFTATTHQGTTNDGTGGVVIVSGFCTGDFSDYGQQSN